MSLPVRLNGAVLCWSVTKWEGNAVSLHTSTYVRRTRQLSSTGETLRENALETSRNALRPEEAVTVVYQSCETPPYMPLAEDIFLKGEPWVFLLVVRCLLSAGMSEKKKHTKIRWSA
jgi:hypothetical protein